MALKDIVDDELVVPLIDAIISEDMVATQQLINSIKTEVEKTDTKETVRIFAEDYLLRLRDGTQFTKKPSLEDIENWIIAKNLEDFLNPYAVLENINQFGTSWDQEGGSKKLQNVLNKENIQRIMNIAIESTAKKIKETKWQLR